MGFVDEFKQFAVRGNVVDLAVGVIIGAAFGKIVTAMVEKILMPIIGMIVGGVDFSNLAIVLAPPGPDGKGGAVLGYGVFIQTVVDFIIVAFCLFIAIKGINRLKAEPPPKNVPAPAPPEDILLLREIRDSLKK